MSSDYSASGSIQQFNAIFGLDLAALRPDPLRPTVKWVTTGQAMSSANVTLDPGGVVYLTVEGFGEAGWDWLVWDAGRQIVPCYGLATTEEAAKRDSELMIIEITMILVNNRSSASHGRPIGRDTPVSETHNRPRHTA